jgi:hypothetical protein
MENKSKDLTYKDIDHVNVHICTNHDDITLLCGDILKYLDMDLVYVDGKVSHFDNEIRHIIKVILDRVKQAKYQGIKMEKRLMKYRKTIEKLGFLRVDKNNL